MYEKRDILGMVLIGVSVLILIYMFLSPLTHIIINIDEYWTYSLVTLPLKEGMIVAITKQLLYSEPVQGFATIMCAILLLGGIQLLPIGVLGKYLEKNIH